MDDHPLLSFIIGCVYSAICIAIVVLMLTHKEWGDWIDAIGAEPVAQRECPK